MTIYKRRNHHDEVMIKKWFRRRALNGGEGQYRIRGENEMKENHTIRKATMDDIDQITELEALCFPEKEAATREDFEKRLKGYPDHFALLGWRVSSSAW